ncbi:MAG: NnrU family protein [Gammaproteobacteria bacterium]|nr:NnrU family protein [Gammaproteobacteria bacterium]
MAAAFGITLLWILFAGSHMALSATPVRRRLVHALGEWPFRGLYSLISFAFFIPLVWMYFQNKHAGALLWSVPPGPAVSAFLYLGNAMAFVLAAGGYFNPSPSMVGMGRARHRPIHDLTRHPLFMGIGLWGLMHLVPNGFASDVAFFGGFVLFALIGSWHQDARLAETRGEEYRSFLRDTPFVPFTGKNTLRGLKGFPLSALVVGIAITAVLRYFHASWFV